MAMIKLSFKKHLNNLSNARITALKKLVLQVAVETMKDTIGELGLVPSKHI